ncbi:alpha amylase C-terminal domain-containing protein, partial [Kitasatospora sp. NPDC001175]
MRASRSASTASASWPRAWPPCRPPERLPQQHRGANFSPVVRRGYRTGLPLPGAWQPVLDTDAARY